jgi:putative ABC transport system ATP-binding protein
MDMSNRQNRVSAIEMAHLHFSWNKGHDPILDIEHLQISQGERVFIEGPSGSGKSTLLNLIAGIVLPDQGALRVNGAPLGTFSGARRDRFRADHIGFIYQMFNLIPYLSVIENVTLPCRFSRYRRKRAQSRENGFEGEAMRLLKRLGMDGASVINRPTNELSVGQQQRVAAARALIGAPEIIIADEPTSSLDTDLREAFIQLLFGECARQGSTVVFVSHDTGLEKSFDRTIRLTDINTARQ